MSSIFNPQLLDTLARVPQWLEEHFSLLRDISAGIADQEQHDHYQRRRDNVVLDASGAGRIEYTVPSGYDWSLERITVTSTGNGICQIYLNSVTPQETVEIIGSSQIYSDGFSNNIFAQQGEKVIIAFTGAGNGGTATVNLQIKLLKRNEKATTQLKAYAE